MAMNPRLLRPSGTFTPKSIPGLALWLDASDTSTLFQNSDGTVPATTASDPVGYWGDKSGNNRHATQATAANRPRIASSQLNGRNVAEWHSNASRMAISSRALENSCTVFAVTKRGPINWGGGGGAGYGTFLGVGTSAGGPGLRVTNGVIGILGGTNESTFTPAGSLGVTSHVLLTGSLSNLASSLWVNGALVDSDAAAGSGSGNAITEIGAWNPLTGGGGPLNAEIAEVISYPSALTTAQRRQVETYLARKWGITLAPQVSNADAQDWINRVYANGGTVSASTASAVSAFCQAIDAAGIRDRFYRLNLFCGDNLAAALVPLYRGPVAGGTTYGNATDTNNAFVGVGTDYAETGASGGLTGNGSTKYLLTGLTTAALPSLATGHLSVYAATYPTSGIRGLLTSWGSGFANPLFVMEANRNGAGHLMTAWGDDFGGRNFTPADGVAAGHLVSSRVGSTDLRMYRSGSQIGSTVTASVTPAANNGSGFAVFCNYGSAPANYSDARIGAYSIGSGFSDTEAADYYTAMQAFQTALGRNV